MNWKVPLFDPDFGEAELAAVQAPVREGWLTMGPRTQQFEEAFCQLTGAAHTVAVNSCTAALHLCLAACGIGPGDEVICPTLTFVATANAIRYTGARPVFCESTGPTNLNADVSDIREKITPRTRAILVVHYAGFPADMQRIVSIARERNLMVIEDCAHACISRLRDRVCGRFGRAGCFSFFSNKNVTCGEGGAIITDDAALAERLKRMRSHGMTSMTLDRHKGRAYSYDVIDLGYNYRLDEIRASLLMAQLTRLPELLERRTLHYQDYRRCLDSTPIVVPDFDWREISQPGDGVGYHIMPVLLPTGTDRLRVIDALRERGVQSSIHYPPIHQFSSFAGGPALPRSEGLAARQLTLPLYPGLDSDKVAYVCAALLEAVGRQREAA